MSGKPFIFRFADIEVREREFCLIRSGEAIPVEPKAFRVLLILLRNPEKLIPKDELLQAVWGDTAVTENSLARSVALLRRLLGDETRNPRYIETVATVGYRFLCTVEATEEGSREVAMAELAPAFPSQSVNTVTHRKVAWRRGVLFAALAALFLIAWVVWYTRPRTITVTNITQITNDRKAKIPFIAPHTDGVRLYLVEGMPFNSGSGIAQISVTGGETTFIDTTLREVLVVMDISPDRSKLLVHNGVAIKGLSGELWIQPLPAGSPFRVGNLLASSASFTPDSAHILYGEGRVLKIVNLDGSDPRPLANLPGLIRSPRFSPDGRLIRFWSIQPQGTARSIWEMNADGSHLHLLLPNWKESDECCGIWSPDGDDYFFQARQGNEQSVWVLPERRSIFRGRREPYRLISGPIHFGGPSPSLDGKRLFVVGDEARAELFRFDPNARRVDSYLGSLSAGPVDFSPDGKWIAYVSYPDQTLWRSRLDLTEKMQLTFPPVKAYGPRWSPDSSRIVFDDVQIHKPWTISVISAAGGDLPKPILPANSSDAEGDPTWTPDGKSIIFFKAAAAGEGLSAIYRLNLETGDLIRIPGSEGFTSPRLSPDGRYIAALKVGGKALMLFDQGTNQWSTLAEGEAFGYNEWSRDGKFIYARSNQGGSADVVRVRIKDHILEHILSLKDFPALVDPFANWIGLTPDGGVLPMRDRSVQEIYALDLDKK